MSRSRITVRDPRNVARDIPGILDMLFPRLSGGFVASLNKSIFSFDGVDPVDSNLIEKSKLQKSVLFELSAVRAERILSGSGSIDWGDCLLSALDRQKRYYDVREPSVLEGVDCEIASQACDNLIKMLRHLETMYSSYPLEIAPRIPGLGWIATGNGDFSVGPLLVEVKHTDRNFISSDYRQVLMYFMLKYARFLEKSEPCWSEVALINPRRGCGVIAKFDLLLKSSLPGVGRVDIISSLTEIVGGDFVP